MHAQQRWPSTSAAASKITHGYVCTRWHDFFKVEEVLVPWSPARETMEGVACRRMDFQAIDDVLHSQFSFSWDDVDTMGAHKVHALAVLC